MGLASALATALTGLTAAEATIDVVGNNLANSQTVGFKASDTVFSTQFLQTIGLGSGPSATNGGTNPRQVGLGTKVTDITPDFTQGTIEISGSPSDLAIQGDGFFMVKDETGSPLFTRNGIFSINSQNEVVNTSGQRLLGFGIDEFFQIQQTELVPVTIPIGSAAVAKATGNVFLEGTLTPTGDIADTAEVVESVVLGDNSVPQPDTDLTGATIAPVPSITGTIGFGTVAAGGGLLPSQTYQYQVTFLDQFGTESLPSDTLSVTLTAGDNAVQLNALPDAAGEYAAVRIYRTAAGGTDFFHLADSVVGGNFTDDGLTPTNPAVPINEDDISGTYSYYVTFGDSSGGSESRPSELLGPVTVSDGRIHLQNLPTPPVGVGIPAYDQVRIYRNLNNDSNSFYKVGTVAVGEDFTDSVQDDVLLAAQESLDFGGPRARGDTLLVDVLREDEGEYESLFDEGTFTLRSRKGGRSLKEQDFEVTATSTLQQFIDFIEDASGIQSVLSDPQNPLNASINNIQGESAATLNPGTSITSDGKIRIVSNTGVGNAVTFTTSQLETDVGTIFAPNFGFGTVQEAKGETAVTDFVAYDSLGIGLNVRVTAVLEDRTSNLTTYRWYADSPDNDAVSGVDISIGTGLVTFDGEGKFVSSTNSRFGIDRRSVP
ncbi:MAG: flagellar hook protein FlgE, partial [Pirellulaceae bacterium]